jgi:pimeloyl-ACP methyl ester carboxylesterase
MTLNYISHYFTTHGLKLHAYRLPNVGKPPLILLHGMTDSGYCWPRLAKALMADYDLIMPDARGHGLSDGPSSGYMSDAMAADLAVLIQTLQLNQPIILGHSMGAMTAASLAATFPHLVKAIILEDPGWWASYEPATEKEQAKQIKQWQRTILKNKNQPFDAIARDGRRKNPTWDKTEWYSWAQSKKQVNPNLTSVIREVPPPWREIVPQISCPTLLITADPALGAIVTPEVAAEFATLCPQAQTVFIPNAGHCIRREQFEVFMATVKPFLQQVTINLQVE